MGVRKDSLLGCSVFVLGAGCTQPQCPYKKWDMTRQEPQDWCLLHLYTLDKILRQLEYGFMLIVTIVHDLSCPPGTEPSSGFRLGSLVLICFFFVFFRCETEKRNVQRTWQFSWEWVWHLALEVDPFQDTWIKMQSCWNRCSLERWFRFGAIWETDEIKISLRTFWMSRYCKSDK